MRWRLCGDCPFSACYARVSLPDTAMTINSGLGRSFSKGDSVSLPHPNCYNDVIKTLIGNVTLKWCKFKIHCGNKIEIEISFEKGGLSLLYQMSESFCLWDRFSFSFFFTLGIDTEVSEWLTTKNEELRRWLEKISFSSWNYETDLSEENAEKVRLMNLIKRWISEAIF